MVAVPFSPTFGRPVRAVPPGLDPRIVAAIDARLASIEQEHRVTVLWAIESGSRAWGFPSPDSDYDARFIFARPPADYLSVSQKRDVIEMPIEGVFDVNGWDLVKMAKLILGGNAAAIEWLSSPIVYRGLPGFAEDWLALANALVDRGKVMRHYLHLGEKQFGRFLESGEDGPLKKIFYALRPAMALRWLRRHPERVVAPMNLRELICGCDLPAPVVDAIGDLLVRKAASREMGEGPIPEPIRVLIRAEFETARAGLDCAAAPQPVPAAAAAAVDGCLRRWIAAPDGR